MLLNRTILFLVILIIVLTIIVPTKAFKIILWNSKHTSAKINSHNFKPNVQGNLAINESRRPPMLKSAKNYEDVFPNVELESIYEDLDSDEHIENEDDWYGDLDVLSKTHLLGPSATHHSPVPVQFQHRSDFPFVCSSVPSYSTPAYHTAPYAPPQVQFGFSVLVGCSPSVNYVPCSQVAAPYHLTPVVAAYHAGPAYHAAQSYSTPLQCYSGPQLAYHTAQSYSAPAQS